MRAYELMLTAHNRSCAAPRCVRWARSRNHTCTLALTTANVDCSFTWMERCAPQRKLNVLPCCAIASYSCAFKECLGVWILRDRLQERRHWHSLFMSTAVQGQVTT